MARRRKRTTPADLPARADLPGRQKAGSSWAPDRPDLLELLSTSRVVACRPIAWGSNGTFLVTLAGDEESGESHAVYKPRRGETPLWDFPSGSLYRREMATYLVSEALGWSLAPPTVVRDGPFGVGTVQLFIEHSPNDYFTQPVELDRDAAERIALLDVLLNNADRKSEHCLRDLEGRVWAIDHGLTFHIEPKLRTVIWDFAGEPIAPALLADLEAFALTFDPRGALYTTLCNLVSEDELDMVRRRLRMLLRTGKHPDPGTHRRTVPWGSW
jgi:hypothetical protein